MERLFLLLEFLKGCRHSQLILADMIEEEGDKFFADRVRSRKKGDRKLLQLALEVIPYKIGVCVGIDFFERAISFGNPVSDFESGFGFIRRWIDEVEIDPDDSTVGLEESFPNVIEGMKAIDLAQVDQRLSLNLSRFRENPQAMLFGFTESFESLVEVVEVAQLILLAQRNRDHEKQRRCNNRLRSALVKSASQAREIPFILVSLLQRREVPRWELQNQFSADNGLLKWQLDHVVKTLEQAVTQ